MSEQQPPESPRSQKTPQGAPEGGINWKVIFLFAIAFAIIFAAYKTAGPGEPKELTFPEFREALIEGRILQTVSDDYKGGKLELVTFSGETRAEIRGVYHKEDTLVKSWDDQKSVKSIVQVDINSISDDLNQTFGENLQWVTEAPANTAESEEIPFARLKTLLSENKLVLEADQQFQIFRRPGSNEAVIYATTGTPIPFDSWSG